MVQLDVVYDYFLLNSGETKKIIAAGNRDSYINFAINAVDTIYEGDETFTITLSNLDGANFDTALSFSNYNLP